MQISKKDDQLEAIIRDDFDFEKCRELLQICKTHAQSDQGASVSIYLTNVATFQTCAVATISLISDWVPGRLQVNLRNCDAGVQQIFDSGIFEEYFNHNRPFVTSSCTTCLEHKREPTAQACTQRKINMLLNND